MMKIGIPAAAIVIGMIACTMRPEADIQTTAATEAAAVTEPVSAAGKLPQVTEPTAVTEGQTVISSEPEQTEPETIPQTEPVPPTEGPTQPETQPPAEPTEVQEEAEISFGSFSLFSGHFVEDGRDEPVEQVAAMLVTNTSDQFLDLATLAFEIDGKPAAFVMTGLPAGESAWVMELSGLRAEAGSSFEFCECVPSFRDGVRSNPEELSVTAEGNLLTVKNESDRKLEGVVLYYKNRHTDGNFLGGITYLADAGDLEPGASAQVLAGHYDETCSEIVRMGWKNQ